MREIWVLQLLGLAVWFLVRMRGGRAAAEMRVRVLEALASAARAGVPLGPVVFGAAQESKGRMKKSLLRFADAIETGVPLHEALAGARALRVPGPTIDALRTAEGGPGYADVIDATARASAASLRDAHRFRAMGTYPVILLAFAALFLLPADRVFGLVGEKMDVERSPLRRLLPDVSPWTPPAFNEPFDLTMAAVVSFFVFAVLLEAVRTSWGLGDSMRRFSPLGLFHALPPFRGPARVAATARWLDALAAFTRAGSTLPDGLRLAGSACGHRGVARDADRVADRVESGAPAGEAWEKSPLRGADRLRAAGAGTRAGDDAAATYALLAAGVRARREEAYARRVKAVGLAVILLVAFAIAVVFSDVIIVLAEIRARVPQW